MPRNTLRTYHSRLLLVAAFTFIAASVSIPHQVQAQSERALEAREQARQMRESAQQAVEERKAQLPAVDHGNSLAQTSNERHEKPAKEATEHGPGKLKEKNLKACQNREQTIQNIMARMSDRGVKQLDVITTVAMRTQAFYDARNLSIADYDTLVSEVNTRKLLAEDAVATAHQTSFAFTCNGDDPKGVASLFKNDLHEQNVRLKEYRTAVKDLIVAVKSAQSNTAEGVDAND